MLSMQYIIVNDVDSNPPMGLFFTTTTNNGVAVFDLVDENNLPVFTTAIRGAFVTQVKNSSAPDEFAVIRENSRAVDLTSITFDVRKASNSSDPVEDGTQIHLFVVGY